MSETTLEVNLHDTPVERPWRLATLAGMASYLDAGALITTAAALVMYKDRLDVSAGDVGVLSGLLTLMFAIGALLGGRLGDIYGRRRIFTSALALYLVGVLLMAGAVNTPMLVAGVIAIGLAIGADLPVSLALIDEESPAADRGRMVSFTSVLWAGGIVGASVMVLLVGHLGALGARISYMHLALVATVVLILRARTTESRQWSAARALAEHPDHARATLRPADAKTPAVVESVDFSRVRDLFRRPIRTAVMVTGLYYATWNIAANTLGAFGAFMWVELAKQPVQSQPLWSALSLPPTVVALFIFMRVVDTPRRTRWLAIGCAMGILAWLFPLLLGPTAFALIATIFLFHISASFSGEIVYKVWSQETIPVLLRSTGQGATLASARFVAAGAALGTPTLALANPRLLFALLTGCMIVSSVIGLRYAQRLPRTAPGPIDASPESSVGINDVGTSPAAEPAGVTQPSVEQQGTRAMPAPR